MAKTTPTACRAKANFGLAAKSSGGGVRKSARRRFVLQKSEATGPWTIRADRPSAPAPVELLPIVMI